MLPGCSIVLFHLNALFLIIWIPNQSQLFAYLERLLHCAAEVLDSAHVFFCLSFSVCFIVLYDMHMIYVCHSFLVSCFFCCLLFTINVDNESSVQLLSVTYPDLWFLPFSTRHFLLRITTKSAFSALKKIVISLLTDVNVLSNSRIKSAIVSCFR